MASSSTRLDLTVVARLLAEHRFRRVALQFPDEHLRESIATYRRLVDLVMDDGADMELFIIGDSTFGSSVDDVSAQHVDADVLLYFGSDLSSSGVLPVMVVPFPKPIDVDAAVASLVAAVVPAPAAPRVLVLYEPGYSHAMAALHAAAERALGAAAQVAVAAMPPCADLATWHPDRTRGPDVDAARKVGGLVAPDVSWLAPDVTVWYVGEKAEQVVSVTLQLAQHTVATYSPATRRCDVIHGESREFRERCGGFLRVKDARIVGLVVGSMGLTGDATKDILHRLETLVAAAKKSSYVFVMGRLNEAKLCNFPEIDVFCLISNDDIALVRPKTFHKPVITPWELEVGLGARAWDGVFRTASAAVLTGDVSLETAVRNVVDNLPEDPIDGDDDADADAERDAAVRRRFDGLRAADVGADVEVDVADACAPLCGCGAPPSSSCSSSTALMPANTDRQLTTFSSAAAGHFATRGFQGLLPQVPDGQDTAVHAGMRGIAASRYVPVKMPTHNEKEEEERKTIAS
jgi:diphthamide biosynthesis protein 2